VGRAGAAAGFADVGSAAIGVAALGSAALGVIKRRFVVDGSTKGGRDGRGRGVVRAAKAARSIFYFRSYGRGSGTTGMGITVMTGGLGWSRGLGVRPDVHKGLAEFSDGIVFRCVDTCGSGAGHKGLPEFVTDDRGQDAK
jgi:hypothetical protein